MTNASPPIPLSGCARRHLYRDLAEASFLAGDQTVITRASLPWTSPPYRPSSWKTHVAISSFNENVWISIKILVKFVQKGPINNIQALVQIMAWCRPGAKALSEPMMVGLPMHICVSRPQWVKSWLSTDYVESHDLNQRWHSSQTHTGVIRSQWVNSPRHTWSPDFNQYI